MGTINEIIRQEIQKAGVLPFARFMELALYCPECGYYEAKKDIGRRGDFYTSVSTGSIFGGLLAFQFANWLDELAALSPQPSTLQLLEAGAHDGQLAKDILTWLQSNRPELFSKIEYLILEPSARRQEWQRETLECFQNVRWLSRFNDSTIQRFHGIIFGNELLDAFPVHCLGWNAQAKKWFEWGVTTEADKFTWAKIPDFESAIPPSALLSSVLQLPSPLLAVLPDNYTVELSPAAEDWWRQAAGVLARGRLLTLDYGLTTDEMFLPARPHGTLRAYQRHHAHGDVLASPGGQDLTAHVNFSAIQKTGEVAGLKTEFFGSQAKFLTELVAKAARENLLGSWGPRQARQFQTLTHPEHLGRAFRVLVQSR